MESPSFKTRFSQALMVLGLAVFMGIVLLIVGDVARAFFSFTTVFKDVKHYIYFFIALLGLYGFTAVVVTPIMAMIWAFAATSPLEQVSLVKSKLRRLWTLDESPPRTGARLLAIILAIPIWLLVNFALIRYFIANYNKISLIAMAASASIAAMVIPCILCVFVLNRLLLKISGWLPKKLISTRTCVVLIGVAALLLGLFAVIRERAIFKSMDGWALYFPVLAIVVSFSGIMLIPVDSIKRLFTRSWYKIITASVASLLVLWGFFGVSGDPITKLFIVNHSRNAKDLITLWTRVTDFDHDGATFLFNGGDCSPFNPHIHAGALDIPNNGIDEDCFDGDLKIADTKPEPVKLTHPYNHLDHPNILLFSMDACRRDDVSVYGKDPKVTPNLYNWAKSAVVFDDAISEASWTMPSFAALMTGRYAAEIKGYFGASRPARIPKGIPRLAQIFHKAGYYTRAITSGLRLKDFGLNQGFRKWTAISKTPRGKFSVRVARAGVDFLQHQKGDRPFFLWMHCIDPHSPYVPPASDMLFGHDRRGMYRAEIHFADRAFGMVSRALKDTGLEKNTIVVIFADHGEAFGEHGKFYHGMSTYTEEIRIPFIFYLPGVTHRRIKGLVGLIDLVPTLMDLAHIDTDTLIRGRSLAPFMVKGGTVPPADYLVEQTRYTQEFSLVTNEYQLRYDQSNNILELFDRITDPLERDNLAFTRPDLTLRLRRRMIQKMIPILLTVSNSVKKVLLTKIPKGFHLVKGWFLNGPKLRAIRVESGNRRATVKVILQATGPLRGKHFYLYTEVYGPKDHLLGRRKEQVTHNAYLPSLWRKGDLVLHTASVGVRQKLPNKIKVCLSFYITTQVLKTDSNRTKACFDVQTSRAR